MFFQKTKYEPKAGDTVVVWHNSISGIEATRTGRKPYIAIISGKKTIEALLLNSIKFEGEKWEERNDYFLEPLST